jgi:Cu(I)/Ag(I) efflux system membrane protein CusA/SilA
VWVGFIALFGIAVDDGVVMMTFLKQSLKSHKPKDWSDLKDVICEAGCRRIRPLVMTTTTTIIALMPVMWATGQGSEVMKPMAIPILGGMGIELISLFVVPVIFSFIYEKKIHEKGEIL